MYHRESYCQRKLKITSISYYSNETSVSIFIHKVVDDDGDNGFLHNSDTFELNLYYTKAHYFHYWNENQQIDDYHK